MAEHEIHVFVSSVAKSVILNWVPMVRASEWLLIITYFTLIYKLAIQYISVVGTISTSYIISDNLNLTKCTLLYYYLVNNFLGI